MNCVRDHASFFMSLSFRFLMKVYLNRRRGRPLFLWPEDSWEYKIFFGSRSGDILMRCPVHRRFFLIRRSSIYDSPSMFLFVTSSIQVILMIERRCRITKPCSFFTCRLYRRVDSKIARYILPLTRMVTWWFFQSLWRNRPKDASITWYSASELSAYQNRLQPVFINRDILLSGSCRVGLVHHLSLFDGFLQAELPCRIGESIHYFLYLFSRVGNQCTVLYESHLSHQYPSSLGLRSEVCDVG